MAKNHIPPEIIALIRERTDIVALINESVPLRQSKPGRGYKGACPFCEEKSDRFFVYRASGFYHCYGCGESGSAIDFIMKQRGLVFREAALLLAERAGVDIEEQRTGPTKDDLVLEHLYVEESEAE